MVKVCSVCAKPLVGRAKSGLCAAHWREHTRSPEWRAKVSEANLRVMRDRPELRARRQELGRRMAALPQTAEARQRVGKLARETGYWKMGLAAASTPGNRKIAAKTLSETRLGWCPPELRDEYRTLVKRKFRATEAREIILAQHEKNMREFRRSIGA